MNGFRVRMISWLRSLLALQRDQRIAKERARQAFASTGRGHPSCVTIIGESVESIVVRIAYGHTRPPSRAWFSVLRSGEHEVTELAYEDVLPLGEKIWL